jgi:hypothetical protein
MVYTKSQNGNPSKTQMGASDNMMDHISPYQLTALTTGRVMDLRNSLDVESYLGSISLTPTPYMYRLV